MEKKVKGKVKWFNKEKGYGFINKDNDETDIFVHFSQIQIRGFKELHENDEVTFDMVETENGFQALNVYKTNLNQNKAKKVAN